MQISGVGDAAVVLLDLGGDLGHGAVARGVDLVLDPLADARRIGLVGLGPVALLGALGRDDAPARVGEGDLVGDLAGVAGVELGGLLGIGLAHAEQAPGAVVDAGADQGVEDAGLLEQGPVAAAGEVGAQIGQGAVVLIGEEELGRGGAGGGAAGQLGGDQLAVVEQDLFDALDDGYAAFAAGGADLAADDLAALSAPGNQRLR